jgi:hypothetical protein
MLGPMVLQFPPKGFAVANELSAHHTKIASGVPVVLRLWSRSRLFDSLDLLVVLADLIEVRIG